MASPLEKPKTPVITREYIKYHPSFPRRRESSSFIKLDFYNTIRFTNLDFRLRGNEGFLCCVPE